jgi:hypothetical protein
MPIFPTRRALLAITSTTLAAGALLGSLACGGATFTPGNGDVTLDAGVDSTADSTAADGETGGHPTTMPTVTTTSPEAGGAPDSTPIATETGAGGLTAAGLPGLVLWLRGGVGISTDGAKSVLRWADQSPAHNDAVAKVVTPPVLNGATIGGRPTVSFPSKSGLSVPDAPSLAVGSQDFLLGVVVQYEHIDGSMNTIFQKDSLTSPWPGIAIVGNSNVGPLGRPQGLTQSDVGPLALDGGHDHGSPLLIVFRRVGTQLELRTNGASGTLTGISAAASLSTSSDGNVGISVHDNANPLNGDIAELFYVVGPTSEASLKALEAQLMATYGL